MFNNIFFPKPKSNSIIEPLTCLIRLSILEFKPIGTKISIYENKISYNDPNFLQGALRWSQGDNREDIHNIYNSLIKATQWFKIEKDEIRNIFLFSIKGLKKLKLSYDENSVISHSISYYIQLLQNKLADKKQSSTNSEDNDNTIFLKLKELWNEREVNIVNNILLELEDNRKQDDFELKQESLINAIEIILLRKEDDLTNILKKTTTLLKHT